MEQVLENGPWLIRLVPNILNTWTPNTHLKKDEITTAPVCVKLHNVPNVAFSKVGLSLITTKLGHLITFDAYTSAMCLNSWGCNTYVRAIIEVYYTYDLVDSLIVAIPFQNGSRHSLETNYIEYEWKPPRCDTCKIFDHTDEHCPKKPKTTTLTAITDDGLEVTQKGQGKHASKRQHIDGVRLTKPKPNYFNCPVGKSTNVHGEASTSQPKESVHTNTQLAAKKIMGNPWMAWLMMHRRMWRLLPRTPKKIGRISKKWSMRMPIAKGLDDCHMLIGISFASSACANSSGPPGATKKEQKNKEKPQESSKDEKKKG
uniref:Uncharacterized protein n=1 Tax=Tanacetum cinerariifolium TaxID=118510 RepID=A0A6L2LYF9_TANCI|nr:hypothetical protein [Tanacetum cinerariifolium]